MPVSRTAANSALVLHTAGLDEIPVFVGESEPLTQHDHPVAGTAFHGADGLGGLYQPQHPPARSRPAGGAALLHTLEAKGPDRPALLATGPLTDVAVALALDPSLPGRLERVVAMGGAFGRPRGNITPWAEFNFWADPLAALRVCQAGIPLTIVPLDVTEQVRITAEDVAHANDGPPSLATALFRASLDFHRRAGMDWCYSHDAVALIALTNPQLFAFQSMPLDIIVTGERAGQVVSAASTAERGESIAFVASEIDAAAVRDEILRLSSSGATASGPGRA